ncbi:branched-chain amino acid ABC transporter permease [Mesorhizobium sp. L-8-3]|nr:branched-chain amino acid ABC transporter permease [Mesorhizobium sp. L-8-3]
MDAAACLPPGPMLQHGRAMQIILTGVLLGGTYALIALGLTLQYGVSRIMNLANGETLVAACFVTFWLYTGFQVNPLFGLLIIGPAAFVINWLVYWWLLQPLVNRAKHRGQLEVDSILATFGLLFLFQGLMLLSFGGSYFNYQFLATPFTILGGSFGLNRIVAFLAAALIASALYVFLYRTDRGTAVRAVAVDPRSARLVAIDVRRTAAFAFALGGAITACAGTLLSTFYTFNTSMGVLFTMKALIIVIMGGVGDVRGAVIAALVLGVTETLVASLIDPGLTLAANYTLFILVLLFRPQGIFGRRPA